MRKPKPPEPERTALQVLEEILAQEAAALEEARAHAAAPPERELTFRTKRGYMALQALREHEVRALAVAGRISADEVRRWARRNSW